MTFSFSICWKSRKRCERLFQPNNLVVQRVSNLKFPLLCQLLPPLVRPIKNMQLQHTYTCDTSRNMTQSWNHDQVKLIKTKTNTSARHKIMFLQNINHVPYWPWRHWVEQCHNPSRLCEQNSAQNLHHFNKPWTAESLAKNLWIIVCHIPHWLKHTWTKRLLMRNF